MEQAQQSEPSRIETHIAAHAAHFPARTALVFGARSWTYASLHAEMHRRAAVLVAAGVAPGGIVATAAPVSDDLALALLACCLSDATFLPLSSQWTAAELVPLVSRAQPVRFLTGDGEPHPFFPAISALPLALPGEPGREARDIAARRSASGDLAAVPVLQTTSGTMGGTPKLARVPHRLLTWRATESRRAWWIADGDVLYTPSASALAVRDCCEILARGGTMVLSHALQPETIEAELVTHRVTILATVPAVLRLLAEQPHPTPSGLALRVVRFSAAALPAATWSGLDTRYGATMVQEYASTEGG